MVDLPKPVLAPFFLTCLVGCPFINGADLAKRLDMDGDGVNLSVDCDDSDPDVTLRVFFLDEDEDGFGAKAVQGCEQLAQWSTVGTDCDDGEPDVFPGAPELCDGRDQDCDGEVDEDASDALVFFQDRDGDGDGFGAGDALRACEQRSGTSTQGGDCDDDAWEVHPDAEEVCGDAVDNDCSGEATGCHLVGRVNLGQAALHLMGVSEQDELGGAVAFGGDLFGEGGQTLVVGAPEENRNMNRAGGVYVVSGGSAGAAAVNVADPVWIYGDEQSMDVGSAIAGGSDWNEDGWVDLVVGASNKARVFLFEGPLDANRAVSDAEVVLETAERGTEAGASLSALGDINGDGEEDLLVGAPKYDSGGNDNKGAAFLVLGPILESTLGEGNEAVLLGSSSAGHAGSSVALAGDTNGDGISEVLVGAEGMEGPDLRSGGVGLFQEPPGGITQFNDADSLILGLNRNDHLGTSVAGVGDLNGDGLEDVALGAPGWGSNLDEQGRVYVLLGALDVVPSLLSASATLTSMEEGAQVGSAVSGAGDVNGDGLADLWVGAPGLNGAQEVGVGAAFLLLGPISGSLLLEDSATAQVQGVLEGGGAGNQLAGGGDANGDGVLDLLMGAPFEDSNGQDSGGAYLVLGIGS